MSKYNAIVITRSLRGGHYRAGHYHGPEHTKFPPKTFTEQQMEHLAADTDLVLVDLVPKTDAGEQVVITVTELPDSDGEGSSILADAKPENESKGEAPQDSEDGDAPEPAKPEDAPAPAPAPNPKTGKKKD